MKWKKKGEKEKETFAESLKKEITENAYMPVNALVFIWCSGYKRKTKGR